MKKLLLLIMAFWIWAAPMALAETFKLKNGKTVEGEITELTDDYVKINRGDRVFLFRFSDFDKKTKEDLATRPKVLKQQEEIKQKIDFDKTFEDPEMTMYYWEEVVKQLPKDATAFSNLAKAYIDMKEFEKAITPAQKAIELKPDFAEAYYHLGFANMSLQNVQETIINFEKALEIKPDYTEVFPQLALAYLVAGKQEQAIVYFKKAVEANPKDADSFEKMGVAYFSLKKFDEAKENFNKAKELYTATNNSKNIQKIDSLLNQIPKDN